MSGLPFPTGRKGCSLFPLHIHSPSGGFCRHRCQGHFVSTLPARSITVFPGALQIHIGRGYIGSEQFVADALNELDPDLPLNDIPRVQVFAARQPLEYFQAKHSQKGPRDSHGLQERSLHTGAGGRPFWPGTQHRIQKSEGLCLQWEMGDLTTSPSAKTQFA